MASRKITKGQPQLVLKDQKAQQIADTVIFAAYHGDEAAMERYGVSQRTLSRYRKRTAEVGELASFVSYRLRELEDSGVVDEVEAAISDGLAAFKRVSEQLNPKDAQAIQAYAELFDVVINYDLTRKMLHARLQGIQED